MIKKIDHKNPKLALDIYQLFKRAYHIEAKLLGLSTFPPLNRSMKDIMHCESSFKGYWKGEKLSGIIETEKENDKLHICGLVVDPDLFRKGIGEELVKTILKEKGRSPLTVNTAVDNLPAMRLYQKLDFVVKLHSSTKEGIMLAHLLHST